MKYDNNLPRYMYTRVLVEVPGNTYHITKYVYRW